MKNLEGTTRRATRNILGYAPWDITQEAIDDATRYATWSTTGYDTWNATWNATQVATGYPIWEGIRDALNLSLDTLGEGL